MSNAGNKGVFSNNIGSSVGGFTKRNSGDAGSGDAASGSTAERRRVSRDSFPPLSCPTVRSLFLAPTPPETFAQCRRQLSLQPPFAFDLLFIVVRKYSDILNGNADICTYHSPP